MSAHTCSQAQTSYLLGTYFSVVKACMTICESLAKKDLHSYTLSQLLCLHYSKQNVSSVNFKGELQEEGFKPVKWEIDW